MAYQVLYVTSLVLLSAKAKFLRELLSMKYKRYADPYPCSLWLLCQGILRTVHFLKFAGAVCSGLERICVLAKSF